MDAGAREAFEDADLYDREWHRRRADANFYRLLARERLGFGAPTPALDLACGTGRVLVPLLRDGHTVVGLDHSGAMLARANAKVARLSPARRARCLLMRGDLRAFAFARRFGFAVSAFHSVQHLVDDKDLLALFRNVHAALAPDGWFAFDVLPPLGRWLARDPARRWAKTTLTHPRTGERLIYTTNHTYDAERKALHMRLYYQPVDKSGRPQGPERVRRLCHRQLWPADVASLLERAGFTLMATYADFDVNSACFAAALDEDCHEHVYLARPMARRQG